MSLSDQINQDIKTAMKAREKEKLTLLRSVKATFKNAEIDSGALSESDEVSLIMKMVKQRKEAAAGFRKGGAEDRAQNEDWEAEMLESYLPSAPTEEELLAVIDSEVAKLDPADRTPRAIGTIMGALKEAFAGRPLDGKAASKTIKDRLSNP